MKKIILGALFAFIAFVACKKEADIPAIKFKFSVEIPNEKYSDKGLNDRVNIPIDISPSYNLTKMPIKYKINWDKQGELKIGDTEVRRDEIYTLDTTKIMLSYTGKEVGEHKISLSFFNDKDMNIEKEIKIPYVKYNFNTSIVGGKENIYQGENIEYNLSIAPENTTINDVYKIKFISYDDQDPTLAKSFVGLNGIKIEFGKEYVISDLSAPQRINLKPFYFGNKKLIYKIINNTSEKQEEIAQRVEQSKITVNNLNFNKLIVNSLRERLQIRGYINKTPNINREILYKSSIIDPVDNKDGITNTNNEYQGYTLPPNNEFSIDLEVKKYGTFKYVVQFKDEFGTESQSYEFTIKVTNNDFNIEQKTNTNLDNIFQGGSVDVDVEVKEELSTSEEYQIQFTSFDPNDVYLEKTKVKFNSLDIQLNKWYPVNKGSINKIILNPYYFGDKKLIYQIKNSTYTKQKELELNVKKTTISLQNLSLRYSNNIYINEPFKLMGKVEKTYPEHKNVEFKTWLSLGDSNDINQVTNSYRKYNFQEEGENIFSSDYNISKVGNYTLNIQFKDEFGNESEVKTFHINVLSRLEIKNNGDAIYKIVTSDMFPPGGCEFYGHGMCWDGFTSKITIKTPKMEIKAGTGNYLYKIKFEIDGYRMFEKMTKEELLDLKETITKEFIVEDRIIKFTLDATDNARKNRAKYSKEIFNGWKESKPNMKITVYDNLGYSKEIEVPIQINYLYDIEDTDEYRKNPEKVKRTYREEFDKIEAIENDIPRDIKLYFGN